MSLPTSKSSVFRRGFSLIELMITVALLSLLVTMAFPTFTEWIQNSRIRTAAEAIQNGMNLARAEAVKRNTTVEFVLVGSGSGWTVRTATGTEIQQRSAGNGSSNVTVAVAPNGATTAAFNGFGRTDTGWSGGAAQLRTIDLDVPTSVLAADRSRNLRVTIGVDGAIRMCDPSVSSGDTRSC